MKLKKIMAIFTILIVMFMMAGCSSDEPVVREIRITDYTLDKNNKLVFTLEIDLAKDEEAKTMTSGMIELISTDDGKVFKNIEYGFMPGQKNSLVKWKGNYIDYELGTEKTFKVKVLYGTTILEEQKVVVKYNE